MTTYIIQILSAFLGYVLVFMTLKSSKQNRILNSFLMFIFFTSSTTFLIAGIAGIYNNADLITFSRESDIYTSLFCPCFYIYFTYLIRDHQRFQYKDFTHIIFLLLAILEREFLVLDWLFSCKLNYSFKHFFAIYGLAYMIKIFLLLKNNVWNKKATLSIVMAQNKLIKKWTGLLFIIIVIFGLSFDVEFLNECLFSEPTVKVQSSDYLWITPMVWIVLFLIILSNPYILYGFNRFQLQTSKINPDTYNNDYWNLNSKIKITNINDQILKEKISPYIEKYIFELNVVLYNNSYFINPNFSVKDLAQVLNIPKSHLTFIFKYHTELSFSDYKKISRIQNSIELINTNYLTSNTLDTLARKVGFSSYTPFFNCFKEVVGKSPHDYVSTLKNVSA